MTINFWTLGLQAINVLVLAWLLQRLFWRPVSRIIEKRQAETQALLDEVASKREEVAAAMADIAATRAGFAKERDNLLKAAQREAEDIKKEARRTAQEDIDDLIQQSVAKIARDEKAAEETRIEQATRMGIAIATRLVEGLDKSILHDAFVARLFDQLESDSGDRKVFLAIETSAIELASAAPLERPEKARIKKQLEAKLGSEHPIRFTTEPDLIAGFELHGDHYIIRNSWKSDLEKISRELQHA